MKKFVLAICLAMVLACVGATTTGAVAFGRCDPDGDDLVTMADLLIIRNNNGAVASGPNDPMDGNGDLGINVADVRFCQLRLGQVPQP